jgi:hypothetical protein
MGLMVKSAINANKAPLVQKVIVINYGEIIQAVEKEKMELIDSIKSESKELREQNEKLMALVSKPRIIVKKEKETEIKHNTSNQIIVNQRYTPNYHVIQKKSGTLEIIE